MFDIGWPELLVIAVVLIVVVGPEDLPRMLRAFGKATARMRSMANEFRTQFDEALKEADLEDVRKTISDARSLNPAQHLRDAMNPLRQVGDEIRAGLSDSVAAPKLDRRDDETTIPAHPVPAGDLPASDEPGLAPAESAPAVTTEPVQKPRRRAPAKTSNQSAAAATAAPKRTPKARTAAARAEVAEGGSRKPATAKVAKPAAARKPAVRKTPVAASPSGDPAGEAAAKSPRKTRTRPAAAAGRTDAAPLANGADEGDKT